jgi:hypothetical protein
MKKRKIEEAKLLLHYTMFDDDGARLYEQKDGTLVIEFSDGETVNITKEKYIEGFNITFYRYALAAKPKKGEPYSVIACGKLIQSTNFAEAFGRAVKRMYKKGCLAEAADAKKATRAVMEEIENFVEEL